MFNCTISGITCKFSLLFPAVLLSLLMIDDSGTALFCFSAAFLHECAHGLALCLCGIKPTALMFSFFGMRLDLPPTHGISLWKTLLIAVAGPLGNIICAAMLRRLGASQTLVSAHMVLAVLNSLPTMPLDGGQVVAALCERVFSPHVAVRLENGLFYCTFISLALLGVMVLLHSGGNVTLLAVTVYVGCLRLFCKCD